MFAQYFLQDVYTYLFIQPGKKKLKGDISCFKPCYNGVPLSKHIWSSISLHSSCSLWLFLLLLSALLCTVTGENKTTLLIFKVQLKVFMQCKYVIPQLKK